jgi:hypothetical protein
MDQILQRLEGFAARAVADISEGLFYRMGRLEIPVVLVFELEGHNGKQALGAEGLENIEEAADRGLLGGHAAILCGLHRAAVVCFGGNGHTQGQQGQRMMSFMLRRRR